MARQSIPTEERERLRQLRLGSRASLETRARMALAHMPVPEQAAEEAFALKLRILQLEAELAELLGREV